MKNPKFPNLKPPVTSREKLLDKVVIAMWVLILGLLFYYYPQLPDEVPTHFNGKGAPDAWGPKIKIWILLLMGLGMSVLLFFIYKIPHLYNYTTKITAENASYEYQRVREIMRWINCSMTLVFGISILESCLVAFGRTLGLGMWTVPLILVVSVLPLILYFTKPKRK